MSAWIVSRNHIDQLVCGAIRLGVIRREDATRVGRMLTNTNKKSIRARYGPRDEEAARVPTYNYYPPRMEISDASLYKQVRCYAYQTCEYNGYEDSPAGKFEKAMMAVLDAMGYSWDHPDVNAAPWGV